MAISVHIDNAGEALAALPLESRLEHEHESGFVLEELFQRVVIANGSTRVALQLSVPRNALVDSFVLRVQAFRSNFVKADLAGDVRREGDNIIVDFGAMLTVSKLSLNRDFGGIGVYAWLGAKFDDDPLLNILERPVLDRNTDFGGEMQTLTLPREVRTERLLIEISDPGNIAAIEESLTLALPDLPSDLSLSINGGAPVWEHPGMVSPGADGEPGEDWNSDGEILVPVTEAVQALVGDATDNSELPLELELTARTPGLLGLQLHERSLRLLHRLEFSGQPDLALDFAMEGEVPLSLTPPAYAAGAAVLGAQLKLAAEFPPERGLPAVGAAANGVTELVLGQGRCACVRLDHIASLAQISGARLPLRSGGGRAEFRIILWQGDEGNAGEVVEGGVSDPLGFEGEAEQWLALRLPQPLPREPETVYWLAIIVERGEVIWRLAAADEAGSYPVRQGAPDGPWRALPAIFGSDSPLGTVAGRLHVLGTAADTSPIAPLELSLQGLEQPLALTPTADGVAAELTLPPAEDAAGEAQSAELTIRSFAAGILTLSEVDILTEEVNP